MPVETPSLAHPADPGEDRCQRRSSALVGIGLITFTGIIYWQVRRFEFVNFDDGFYVTENPYVLSGLSFENVAWAFTTPAISNWHPLTWLSLMLDVQLFGRNSGAMHLTNAVCHVANALLLFAVLRCATGCLWRSAFAAALFAVHPLHVESVAWVAERKDVLSTFFGFLAIWCYIRYARGAGRFSYWACLATWTCSLMSKQMFVTLPFLFLLLDYWPLGRLDVSDWKASLRRLTAEKIPLLAVTIVFCTAAFVVQNRGGAVHNSEKYSAGNRICNAALSYVLYLKKMFWPFDLAAFYPHPGKAISVWLALGAGCLLAVLTFGAFRCARSKPYLIVGWLWYLGTLVPVIGLVQIGDQQMADRYTYLPLVGIFIAITWLCTDVLSTVPWSHRTAPAAAVAVLAALTVAARQQASTWRDSEHLFAQAVAVTRPNALAEDALGNVYLQQGRRQKARQQFERALAIDPRTKSALSHLGKLMLEDGQPERALEYHNQALAVDARDNSTRNDLAAVLVQLGRTDEAVRQFQEALRLNPLDFYAHHNLGNIVRAKGQHAEALRLFEIAVRIDPRSALARNSLGSALIDQGRIDEAALSFREAVRLDPTFAPAHENLGILMHGRGNLDGALAHFQRAFELQPANNVFRQNLAAGYVNAGTEQAARSRLDEAIDSFRNAVRLAPRHLDANYRLARALARQRQFPEAAGFFEKSLAIDTSVAEIHLDYAITLRELGQRDRAIEHVREALRLQPDFDAAISELGRLKPEQ
jgi:tetratricopeptide (TPR) repeat protein